LKRILLSSVLLFWSSQVFSRFMQPDPKRQFHNTYSYTGNNPIQFTDPDGKEVHLDKPKHLSRIGKLVGGELAKTLSLDKNNMLVHQKMKPTADRLKGQELTPQEESYLRLYQMAADKQRFDLFFQKTLSYKDKDGKVHTTGFFYSPPDRDEYGEIAAFMVFGQVFHPTEFSEIIINDGPNVNGRSFTGNIVLFVNTHINEQNPLSEQTLTLGHELFHAWRARFDVKKWKEETSVYAYEAKLESALKK